MRSRRVRGAAARTALVQIVLLLVFLGLAVRAAHLSLIDRRGAAQGARQAITTLRLPGERGVVFDRTGAALALSVAAPSVYAVPSTHHEARVAARELSRVLGVPTSTIAERLQRLDRFVFLARWVSREQERAVAALDLPGVAIVYEPRRVYPHKELAAHVIGFANIDGEGVRGVEQQEDRWLRGTARTVPVERDARGRILATPEAGERAEVGGDVALTIDAALQADAEAVLRDAIRESGARGGTLISMAPHSGHVLALAERPTFDPNRFREVPYQETRSRTFLDAFEPGSSLKVFLVAAGIESGLLAPGELIDCEDGALRVSGRTIRDARPYGVLDVAGVVRVSSNVGAVKIARQIGPTVHYEMLRRLGFGRSTGSRFPGESAGVLRAPRHWKPLDQATIAFGQGISVTPIQLAAAVATLANGGEWIRPQLVAARRPADGAWQPTRPEVVRRALRPETAAAVVAMMREVVGPGGTGWRAALRGVSVAGKTGTAQKFDAESGRYSSDRFVAWFVGIVPADEPRLVIVVSLDEPSGRAHTGGAVAAPVFARVAAAQLARLGILTAPEHAPARVTAARGAATDAPRAKRDRRTAAESAPVGTSRLAPLARDGDRVFLPDFHGLTVEAVREMMAGSGFSVQIIGRGQAVDQDPAPGIILAGRARRVRVHFALPEDRG